MYSKTWRKIAMGNKEILSKVTQYYDEGAGYFNSGDEGRAYFYQLLINQELKRLHEEKQINIFIYNHYKKLYKIDKRKK